MLNVHEQSAQDNAALMAAIRPQGARGVSPTRHLASTTTKNAALLAMADAIVRRRSGALSSKPMRSTSPMARKPACRLP